MSERTHRSVRVEASCRARVCQLAVVLVVMGGQPVDAGASPGQSARLTGMDEGFTPAAAEGGLRLSVREIEAQPGNEVPITIRLPSQAELRAAGLAEGVFLLVRNVPDNVSLSAGMSLGRIWVVPMSKASTLRLICKPDVKVPFQLEFRLVGPDRRVLAQTIVNVALRMSETVAALGRAPLRPDGPKSPSQQSPPTERLTGEAEAVLLARGTEVLEEGGIAAARLIFEELARHGSAAGALALARTYDPAHIPRSAASAPEPNIAEARRWYERAAELGNADAKRRLSEIATSR